MKPLSPFELITIWDESSSQPLSVKTLRLLAKACEVNDTSTISHLSIGERDARLLLLREWMFGPQLKIKTDCPTCREALEWETPTSALLLQPLRAAFSVPFFTLEKDGILIRFRLPDSNDLVRALEDDSYQSNPKKIIADCIIEIHQSGKQVQPDALTDDMLQALEQRMSEEDPQADIRMNLICPACRNQWEATFDIVSFLWAEINNWALRTMDEVALLARAFCWSERDILNMSARRRHLYIQKLGV